MFSSNQTLKISGVFTQLKHALQFALEYSGYRYFCFQRTSESYCIGWVTMNIIFFIARLLSVALMSFLLCCSS